MAYYCMEFFLIFNLQEVRDMLATLVLIAGVWILRKSHFWLTRIPLILFLWYSDLGGRLGPSAHA